MILVLMAVQRTLGKITAVGAEWGVRAGTKMAGLLLIQHWVPQLG